MYVRVCLGYDGGIPAPAHGEQCPLFGQLHTESHHGIEVLHLWPLDFPMNTRQTTTTKPLATLWRPVLSGVMENEVGFSGVERVQLAGRRRWMIQRWLCEPMNYADAKLNEFKCKAESWRWA